MNKLKQHKKILLSLWFTGALLFVWMKGVLPAWEDQRSDFSNYYTSAVLLTKGEPISKYYNNGWFNEKAAEVGLTEGAKFAPFPPITAYLYLPLTVFSALQAKRVVLAVNLLLLVVLVFQLKNFTLYKYWEVGVLLSLFLTPIASNVRLGQSYLLICSLIFVVLTAIKKNKNSVAGVVLGFLAVLKYFPIVYLIYAFPKVNKKLLWGLFIAVLACVFVPIFTNDMTVYSTFANELFQHVNGDISGQGQFSFNFQSIDALLANLFIYDAQWNTNVLVDFPLLKTALKTLFAALISYSSVKMFLRSTEKTNLFSYGGIVIGAALLIPASATYHLLLLLPAFITVVFFLRKSGEFNQETFIVMLFIILISNVMAHHIPNVSFSQTINVIIHFPRLLGLMGLFIFLLSLQKRSIQN